MGKKLVIIEAPGKQHKIQSYLGSDYIVLASKGHIVDLPKDKIGIDIKNNFEATWEVLNGKEDILKDIIANAKKADIVYLATDIDREGEGISANIAKKLPKGIVIKRIRYGSITKDAILEAIKNAGEIDQNLVAAYESRRLLDRIVGFKASWPTTQATGGKSAGRVQSATLRFLAEREKEIQSFIPVEYWDINAELITKKYEKILAGIKVPDKLEIKTEELAIKICDAFKKGPVKVSKYESKNVSVKPYAPFITSSLQQAASTYLGWNPTKTMSVAQKLYENSNITYHRTDSTFIIPAFISNICNQITSDYTNKYLPTSPYIYKNAQHSQEAHESIRPTDISIKSLGDPDQNKLYQMVWKRTMSSQMLPAEYIRSVSEFAVEKYVLSANGSKCIFDGWRKCWTYGGGDDSYLPELKIGEEVKVTEITKEKKQTEPPSRYSQGSAVKQMEKIGIGRPATYANTFDTLEKRNYITEEKKSIHVTDLGIKVIDFLVSSNFCFIDLTFTSQMESKLDDIANNKTDKLSVLTEFWTRLKQDLENAKAIKDKDSHSGYKCPKCKSELLKKNSKFGAFFACSAYSKGDLNSCDYTAKVDPKTGEPIEKVKVDLQTSDKKCPN